MSDPTPPAGNHQIITEIRARVDEDFARISQASDPFQMLGLPEGASFAEVRERYERYEKFYRADNFHRFNDLSLTRRALDIRRALGRAIMAINSQQRFSYMQPGTASGAPAPIVVPVDSDSEAMADIYFRDGLTFLKLRDLNSAEDFLQRAFNQNPNRAIILAYLSYARFKLRSHDPNVVSACGESLRCAAQIEPESVDIHILMARYALNVGEEQMASEAIARVEALNPAHPRLAKLRERLRRLDGGRNPSAIVTPDNS